MTQPELTPIVQTRQLRKAYQMGSQKVVALAGVDVDIPANSFTVIMGPSGSGKSTLLYLIGGLDRPTSGSIKVNNTAIESMDENNLAIYRRQTMGFIFQSFNLISSMTAQENTAFPMCFSGVSLKERRERSLELLKLVGLGNRAHHKPTELSGGQQQRVAVARALVNNPGIILADEPTGNLDTASGMSVMELLSDLHRNGRTLIVVTHDPRMIRFATNVIYLLDGALVSSEAYHATIDQLNKDNDLGEDERQ
jgi:putative ABC transport system ATP-binding protein